MEEAGVDGPDDEVLELAGGLEAQGLLQRIVGEARAVAGKSQEG